VRNTFYNGLSAPPVAHSCLFYKSGASPLSSERARQGSCAELNGARSQFDRPLRTGFPAGMAASGGAGIGGSDRVTSSSSVGRLSRCQRVARPRFVNSAGTHSFGQPVASRQAHFLSDFRCLGFLQRESAAVCGRFGIFRCSLISFDLSQGGAVAIRGVAQKDNAQDRHTVFASSQS